MNTRTTPLAILVAGMIVACAVYFSTAKPRAAFQTGDPSQVFPVTSGDHILGNPAARVVIVEYADFECTYCKTFNDTLHAIVANEGARGDVAVVFRHFPLTEVHPNALSHARATECAASIGGNDAFWKFADLLYAKQPVDPDTYGSLAASIGLTGTAFASCYATASTTLDASIAAERQNALDIGARGTPYSVILARGKEPVVVDGAYGYDDLKLLVDQALTQ